jgi:hypothetical protein
MSSGAQIHANHANAQLSTGPKTPEGKTKSSLNAVKSGLTGRTVLLPSDDAIAYQKHIQRFFDEYKPATDAEETLVQSVADTEWRLLRIPSLEMGIYAIGRIELAANSTRKTLLSAPHSSKRKSFSRIRGSSITSASGRPAAQTARKGPRGTPQMSARAERIGGEAHETGQRSLSRGPKSRPAVRSCRIWVRIFNRTDRASFGPRHEAHRHPPTHLLLSKGGRLAAQAQQTARRIRLPYFQRMRLNPVAA